MHCGDVPEVPERQEGTDVASQDVGDSDSLAAIGRFREVVFESVKSAFDANSLATETR